MNRPRITIITGTSIDGKITIGKDASSKIFDQSIPKSAFIPLVELKEKNDAVMVGCNTILTDNANLIGNEFYGVTNKIKRLIVDSTCKIPIDYRIFTNEPEKTILATTTIAPVDKVNEIRKTGAEVIVCGDKQVDLKELFKQLADKGMKAILVEGGGKLNYSLIKENLVDELIVVIFPFIVGDKDAPALFEGRGFLNKLFHLDMKEIRILDGNIFIHYLPKYNK